MKNKTFVFIVFFICAGFLLSCEDIFEKNLKKENVEILAPTNGLESDISTITFWWNEVDGALGYSLQVVSPTFSSVSKLILDTNISKNKFTYSLIPGSYQWRVRAYNNSSETDYVTYSLTIDSTADITQQTIILVSPSDKDTTNQMSFTFRWDTIYNADDYRFEIWIPDFSGTNFLSVTLEADNFNYTLVEGAYEWGVRGQNSTTNTQYSKRTIYVDTTNPNTPALLTPTSNDTISDSLSLDFSWSRGTVTGSSIKDSLYIYTDQTMAIIKRQKYLNSTTYTDSLGIGNYWWRIRSIDAAGNYSSYSVLRKFTVQ
jgi:hypothetical protein